MPDIIEIEGDVVRHIRREVVAETSLAQATPYIERRAPSIWPILPDHVALTAFDPDEQRGVLIVERVPERVNLNVWFDRGLTGGTPADDYNRAVQAGPNARTRFNIQLPYLYFVYGFKINIRQAQDHVGLAGFTLDRSTLWWRKDPLRKVEDRLWPAQLPNVNRDAQICWGTPAWDHQDTMAMRINQMVNEFPITEFTNHYGMPRPAHLASYVAWETESENPVAYREWPTWEREAGSVIAKDHALKVMSNGHGKQYGTMPSPEDMADVLIPEPPRQFTMGRLRQWIEEIPAPMRARFLAEAARVGAEDEDDG